MSDDLTADDKEFEGQMSEELYRDLLKKAYEKNASLQLTLDTVRRNELGFRDQAAIAMYPIALEVSTHEEAAVDAYRAADTLLRVRETGQTFESDLITLLKQMRDNSERDEEFGRTVRNFLTDK